MSTCSSCGADNRAGARYCDSCGGPLTSQPESRRKPATLLFCDASGSTALGERLDPEAVRELMFTYFHEMRQAIERHEGTVEKFVGDAVMAVFGAPTAHEDDPLRACRAAYEMQLRLRDLNEDLERRYGARLAWRIGINSGEVVAGDPSTPEAFVSGDAVNVAARLEQAAAPGEILLGERTYMLVRDSVQAEAVEPIRAKGKSEPVRAFRLVHVPLVPQKRRLLDTPLVGRERELAALRSSYEAVCRLGSPRLAVVLGEPGIGKSRLTEEFLRRVATDARVLTGRCPPFGEGASYWALAEVVRQAAAIYDEHDPEQARERLEALLGGDDEATTAATVLARVIGLADGRTTPAEIAWATRQLVQRLAADQPLVVVLDDLQWAADALLAVVRELGERCAGPILLLCLARPELAEEHPEWLPSVRLGPLGKSESEVLVTRLLPGAPERLIAAAGGNPLFLEELAAMVAEGASPEEMPATLEGLLAARLDGLPDGQRAAAERASVQGQVFHRGAVVALSDEPARAGIPAAIGGLVVQELVLPTQADFTGEAAFRFRHLLIRDAVYSSLAKRRRARFHEGFAGWLELKARDRANDYHGIIGHHLEQAFRYRLELGLLDDAGREVGVRAGRMLAEAGRRAFARGDLPSAVDLLTRATALLPDDDEERLERMLDLSFAVSEMGEFERAKSLNAEVVDHACSTGHRRLEARARLGTFLLRLFTEPVQTDELIAAAGAALPVAEESGDEATVAQSLFLLGLADWNKCQVGRAETHFQRALVHAKAARDWHLHGRILSLLAISTLTGPTPVEEGLRRYSALLAEAEGNRTVEGLVAAHASVLEAMRGNFGEARESMERGRAILEDLGKTVLAAVVGFDACHVELLAGDPAAAEAAARRAYLSLEALGETGNLSALAAVLAESLYRIGEIEEAERFTVVSEQTSWPDDLLTQAAWRATRAKILARTGASAAGEGHARDAVALLAGSDSLSLRADALASLAEILRAGDRDDEAATAIDEALSLYEAKGNAVAASRLREALPISSTRDAPPGPRRDAGPWRAG